MIQGLVKVEVEVSIAPARLPLGTALVAELVAAQTFDVAAAGSPPYEDAAASASHPFFLLGNLLYLPLLGAC